MSASQASRKPTNLSLDAELVREARAHGVNISQAAEAGVRRAVADARAEQWRRDNAAAVASSNRWVDENGLPLDRHRAAAAAEICAEEVTDGADGAYLHAGRAAPAVVDLADLRLAACIGLLHEQKIARAGFRAAAAADAAVFMDAYAHNDLL